MKLIASFKVDHTRLLPGIYVSRKDAVDNSIVTTFDIRITRPNFEPVMNTAEIHAIEHIGATFLRNHPVWGSKIIYSILFHYTFSHYICNYLSTLCQINYLAIHEIKSLFSLF